MVECLVFFLFILAYKSSPRRINIKNHTFHFLVDIISMKNPDPNHIKIDEKQYKNIIVYCDGYERPHSAKPLKLFINKKKGYITDINKFKYLTLIPNDESKQMLNQYEELWWKANNLIRSANNNSDQYEEIMWKSKSIRIMVNF